MKKIASIILLLSFLLSAVSCIGFGPVTPAEEPSEAPKSENPHFDKYIADDLFDNYYKNSNYAHLRRYEYEDDEAIPMYMGGYAYYGGFTLEAEGANATFDISEYAGKTISFVMGSAQRNGFQDSGVSIITVSLDGEQLIEERFAVPDTPRWYTLDLTGKSELSFKITHHQGGTCMTGVAEITVWDSPDKVTPTAHVSSEGGVRAQLVKDLYPYLFEEGLYFSTTIYSERILPEYMTGNAVTYCTTTDYVSVGGKKYTDAFGLREDMPMIGESVSSIYFNTEKQYGYLSFMVGGEDVENAKAGSAWLTVYADGEMVHEELVVSNALPRRYTVPINNCQVLKFEVQYEDGGANRPVVFDAWVGKSEADAKGTVELTPSDMPDTVKLVSSIKPYAVSVSSEDAVFDGSSKYYTFTMAGRKYNEGIILYPPVGLLTGNSGSHACFNLEGQFKYLTFKAGLLDSSPCIIDDTLNIYLDGVLSQSIKLTAMDLPVDYTVELNNCRELKLELTGRENSTRPAYALAEMVVYKNEVTEHDLFPREETDYPDSMPLIENIKPYTSYVAYEKDDYTWQTVYEGDTKKEYFEINGEKIYSGLLLSTSVHLDLAGEGGGADAFDMLAAMMTSCVLFGDMAILTAGVLHENAFAGFDVRGEFSKLTFTVACRESYVGCEDETTLMIGSSDEIMKTITLTPDMQPTTYTVDINNTEQLVFFLKCGDSSSAHYAIYDITVEK